MAPSKKGEKKPHAHPKIAKWYKPDDEKVHFTRTKKNVNKLCRIL